MMLVNDGNKSGEAQAAPAAPLPTALVINTKDSYVNEVEDTGF